jgi:hypothetical protein
MNFDFESDEDTLKLFQIVAHFLRQYFNYPQERAIDLVNKFYNERKDKLDDDMYHHASAFSIAVDIHYFEGLNLPSKNYLQWKKENNYIKTPKEAIEYFNQHYFDQ